MQFILERIDAIDKKFDEKLDKILVQTTKTNGRVDNLEGWKKTIQKLFWFIAGIIGSILVLLIQNKI